MATAVWLRRIRWRPTVLNTCVTSLGVHMNRSNRCLKHGKKSLPRKEGVFRGHTRVAIKAGAGWLYTSATILLLSSWGYILEWKLQHTVNSTSGEARLIERNR